MSSFHMNDEWSKHYPIKYLYSSCIQDATYWYCICVCYIQVCDIQRLVVIDIGNGAVLYDFTQTTRFVINKSICIVCEWGKCFQCLYQLTLVLHFYTAKNKLHTKEFGYCITQMCLRTRNSNWRIIQCWPLVMVGCSH